MNLKLQISIYMFIYFYKVVTFVYRKNSDTYAKQKHLRHKKVQGQSEATLQTGRCNQLRPRSYFIKDIFNSLNDTQ